MSDRSFSLEPFPSAGLPHHLEITGSIVRRSHTLFINYAVRGPLAELAIPSPADLPARRNGLWEETCFEFFIGAKESDHYWEFNLSPAGHWNVYRFKSYREGMQEVPAFTSLPFSVLLQPEALRLSLELDLDKIVPVAEALEVAISAVIKTMNGKTTYWALAHPGPQADFHRRESFTVEL